MLERRAQNPAALRRLGICGIYNKQAGIYFAFKTIANKFEQEIANGMDAHQAVIDALGCLHTGPEDPDDSTPTGSAIHYLQKRQHQLDDQEAIRNDLPIGSGEVESAHRHILQKRLKIPGAWWRLERAEEMAQLRAMRANQRWDDFWQKKCA